MIGFEESGRFAPPYEFGSLADALARCGDPNLDLSPYSFAEWLEGALANLLEQHRRDTITSGERSELLRLIEESRLTARSELPRSYSRQQIDLGFNGAAGLAFIWAAAVQERSDLAASAKVWQLWLQMFLADVENMNRARRLRNLPQPIALQELIAGPAQRALAGSGGNVVPFPPRTG